MPVADVVRDARFFVPHYQRGYRWTVREVHELLDDLSEFLSSHQGSDKSAFYCLQPIVVKWRPEGRWELVDGQQRMTTLFLLLTCLQPGLPSELRFSLEYETREASKQFLERVATDRDKRKKNIDFYHISNAFEAMQDWLDERSDGVRQALLECLLNKGGTGRTVKLIWYVLPEIGEHPVEAFTRLNVGKIALTDAELIRALFLRSGNFGAAPTATQLRIAQEWDAIEKALQANAFWYFLQCDQDRDANRIEFVFDVIARDASPASGDRRTFCFFMDDSTDAEAQWLSVKRHFMTFQEWFEDRTLYHLVGFLVHEDDDMLQLLKLGRSEPKNAFERMLKQRIFVRLTGCDLEGCRDKASLQAVLAAKVDELDYLENPGKIRSFLLLFNIATMLASEASNLRFPFDLYKTEDWDIEHIRSVASAKPNSIGAQRKWLQNVAAYIGNDEKNGEMVSRIESLCKPGNLDLAGFDALYGEILGQYSENDSADTDNSIGNLTLLDAATNRSYKNAVFPLKRQRILERDLEGIFVPHCTRNVFLKCYSKKVDGMLLWSQDDRTDYRDAIVNMLVRFFWQKGEEA